MTDPSIVQEGQRITDLLGIGDEMALALEQGGSTNGGVLADGWREARDRKCESDRRQRIANERGGR